MHSRKRLIFLDDEEGSTFSNKCILYKILVAALSISYLIIRFKYTFRKVKNYTNEKCLNSMFVTVIV